ncbi:WD40 domain containing protein [Ceratobasidium theobromae]|uniref:WD40 domain containing protein n=1 Tax=Ceratobasidium theobromae TaxID=1582974 RepID=A0A5N5QVJ4_9AGAM|nr:WD40 domain containing protein [Ceratobasidium theobromae]
MIPKNETDAVDVISFEAPYPFTALTFTANGILLAGGEDGSLRIFDLTPTARRALRKAIQGLPHEVTSICSQTNCSGSPSEALGAVWVASGKQIYLFDLDLDRLVIKAEEAQDNMILIDDDGDEGNVLNQIAMFKDLIAYSCDSGSVGVLEIQTKNRRTMRAMHTSVRILNFGRDMWFCCFRSNPAARKQVSFLNLFEDQLMLGGSHSVVSGGYDAQLIHFDASLGSVLSKLDVPAPATSDSSISFSPPFLLSISINSTGVLAAATADGRVIVGRGGERGRGDKPNRRKWNGLNFDMVDQYHLAEGPIVGISWVGPSELLSASLGGKLKHFRIPDPQRGVRPASGATEPQHIWAASTSQIHKVNSLAVFTTPGRALHIAVGGLTSTGRGCVEVWKRQHGDGTIG